MKYVTKIDNTHVVSFNGKNVKVDTEGECFKVYQGESRYQYFKVDCKNLTITSTPSSFAFTEILVAVELVKFVKEFLHD